MTYQTIIYGSQFVSTDIKEKVREGWAVFFLANHAGCTIVTYVRPL